MVEYLLFPAAFLLLLALLAVQFLVGSFTYGPRTRRVLALLAAPAAAGWAVTALALPWRSAIPRVVVGFLGGSVAYLTMAVVAVLHRRDRKLSALVGDAVDLRRRVAERQSEVDRLFWQMSGGAPAGQADAPWRVPATQRVEAPALREWQRAGGPGEERLRAARLSEWRDEFLRSPPEDLAARARVMEAARLDVPEAQRDWLDARLAVLWTVYRERSVNRRDEADIRHHWETARQEVARLQAELAATLRQRAALQKRRLPLD